MSKIWKILLTSIKWIGIFLISVIVLLLAVRFVGKTINSRTPDSGINESMYVEINGT